MALGVKIILIEFPDPLEHFAIMIDQKVIVSLFTMAWIKGMIAEHVEGFFRHPVFYDVVNVFVVPPGKMNLVQTASFFKCPMPIEEAGTANSVAANI